MKFNYLINIQRSGDKTYTVQVRDNGVDKPATSKPVTIPDWQTVWKAVPRHIEKRESQKIADYKAALAKPPEPKDWVPAAAGQPTKVATPAPLPTPEPAPGTAPVATAPMPEITEVTSKRGPGRPRKQTPLTQ